MRALEIMDQPWTPKRILNGQAIVGVMALSWAIMLQVTDSWWHPATPSAPFYRAVAGAWLLLNLAMVLRLLLLRLGRGYRWIEHASLGVPVALMIAFEDVFTRATTSQMELNEAVVKFIFEAILFTILLWWFRRDEAEKLARGA